MGLGKENCPSGRPREESDSVSDRIIPLLIWLWLALVGIKRKKKEKKTALLGLRHEVGAHDFGGSVLRVVGVAVGYVEAA